MTSAAAIFEAVRAGDVTRVQSLLQDDPALVYRKDDNSMTPLVMATYFGQPAVVNALIDAGAPVDIFMAAALGRVERIDQLRGDGTAIHRYSEDGWTPLALAAHFGQIAAGRALLAHGADVHARSRNRNANTPLHAALAGGHVEMAALLLENGADATAQDGGGWTPLHLAAQNSLTDAVRMLLERGARVDLANNEGVTPLALAERAGNTEIVDMLRRPM